MSSVYCHGTDMAYDKNCFQKSNNIVVGKEGEGWGGEERGVGWYTALKLSAVSMQTLCLLFSRLIIDSYILLFYRY